MSDYEQQKIEARCVPPVLITSAQKRREPDTPVRPVLFSLMRDIDISGTSGTGKVAEGVIYSDGHVAMRWIVKKYRSTAVYDSIRAVKAIHGHRGSTRIVIHD